jgi:predicted transcriptional regulator
MCQEKISPIRLTAQLINSEICTSSYYNDKKMRYYFGSLQERGCITLFDVLKGAKRYRLTEKGIEAVSYMQESYDKALYKFTQDNNIVL